MGVEARKKREKDIRKKDIIDAAEKVFFLKGINNATMDDVAKEAEFSKRTIYVYFKSKEQLYFEIMLRGHKLLNAKFKEGLEQQNPQNGLEKIRLLGETMVAFSNENPKYFKAIIDYENGDMDFHENNDSIVKECYEQGEQLLQFLSDALNQGIMEGSIKKSIDVTNTALVLWASIVGVLNTSKKKEKYLAHYYKRTSEQLIEEALRMLLRSIKR